MKLGGLRTQLSLWHAGLMALTLAALAVFTYVLLTGLLHSRADAALFETADATARQIAITMARVETRGGKLPLFLSTDIRNWSRYIEIVD